jgi:hypothetical protein
MPKKRYPLIVESVGTDIYIVMSKGHYDFTEIMTSVVTQYQGWLLGGLEHVSIKATLAKGGWSYKIVSKGKRGA